ncbi:MAG: inositol monophosphatase family protein [Rhodobiaceae bacterium]|nr:inositol monophosphatase family protein [Rhodobiaceae bacterium]
MTVPFDLDECVHFAITATCTASDIPRRHFRKWVGIETKADESPVTIADRDTERALRDAIAVRFPDHAIFGEEFGRSGDSRYTWIIDPIDGTKAFITGLPLYGMLVALLEDERPVLGIVRMPELGEAYVGAGGRAWRHNDTAISTSPTRTLKDATLYLCEPNRMLAEEPDVFARLLSEPRLTRMSYDCYPHALLASGHIDATVDYGLQPYDYFPLVPLIEGAGGIITDWEGQKLTLASDGRIVAAATPDLHAELLALIGG